MTRWLLNTFPTWLLALLVVGVLVGLAAAGQHAVRRRWPRTAEGEHNDVAQRLHFAEDSLPGAFQVLILGGAVVLIGFMYFIGIASSRVQMTMTLGIAALIAFNLLLIVLLDHPFSGDIGVSDKPFHQGALVQLARE